MCIRDRFLTEAGQSLVRTARAMVEEWSAFEQEILAMQGLHRGRLRVAVVSTAKYFVPRILGAFCGRYPEIEIALEINNRDGVVARLRDNRDDLYILSRPPAEIEVEQHPFLDNPLVVVAPEAHPLAGGPSVELKMCIRDRVTAASSV